MKKNSLEDLKKLIRIEWKVEPPKDLIKKLKIKNGIKKKRK